MCALGQKILSTRIKIILKMLKVWGIEFAESIKKNIYIFLKSISNEV